MPLEKSSPCKVNLILNILGRRPDGFHELETIMQPVQVCDRLSFARAHHGITLSCSDRQLPTGTGNLVYRAAQAFLTAAGIADGVQIHLDKHIPLAAGLGGGSGNAATTLQALNELHGFPLAPERVQELAAGLGSDVPFFLQSRPALALGRGEQVEPLQPFPALRGAVCLLIHPGFGISTAWAYQQLGRFPEALHGRAGRARALVERLQTADLSGLAGALYNSLEAPALEKYPLLELYQEFLRAEGASATLMSGSGSTTFALVANASLGRQLEEKFKARFGRVWTAVVGVSESASQ